jgi:hypothetical protein
VRSSSTSALRSLTSVSAPPITPAIAMALGVRDHDHPRRGARAPSSVAIFPSGARRRDRAAAHHRGVEGVERLAELEHHQVGDVDDDVDRAHAGGFELRREPRRARPDADAAHDARAVARAAVGVVDRDAHRGGGRVALFGAVSGIRSGPPTAPALARDAEQPRRSRRD